MANSATYENALQSIAFQKRGLDLYRQMNQDISSNKYLE
jgi:hypothetical protein